MMPNLKSLALSCILLSLPTFNTIYFISGNKLYIISFILSSFLLSFWMNKIDKYILIYFITMTFLLLVNSLVVHAKFSFDILFLTSSILIITVTIENKKTYILFELPLYALLATLFILYIVFEYRYTNFNSLGINSKKSINYISALLTFGLIGYCISRHFREKRVSFIILCLYLYESYFLYSRTSIVISLLVFAFCLPYTSLFKNRLDILFILLFIATPLIIYFKFDTIQELMLSTKWKKGFDTPRFSLWIDYYNSLDLTSLFFGSNLNDISSIANFAGNPHNSFITLFSKVGIIGFTVTFLLYIYNMNYMIKNKQYLFILLSLVMILRIFFDKLIFFGTYDYYFMFFLISFSFKNKIVNT